MFNKFADLLYRDICKTSQMIGIPANGKFYQGLPSEEFAEAENILCFSHGFKNRKYISSKSHHHRFLLAICLKSTGYIVVDELYIKMNPGSALLIHPFQFHHYAGLREEERLWQFISFECDAQEKLSVLKDNAITLSVDALTSLNKIITSYSKKKRRPQDLAIIELSLNLLLQEMILISNEKDFKNTVDASREEKNDRKFITNITQYIYSNLKRPIQVADIAEKANISKSHLRNKFKDIMGLSIGKYLQRTRVHRACILLSGSEANISEIALECGFDSLYSFSRAFKNEMGISPSKYRTG